LSTALLPTALVVCLARHLIAAGRRDDWIQKTVANAVIGMQATGLEEILAERVTGARRSGVQRVAAKSVVAVGVSCAIRARYLWAKIRQSPRRL